MSTTSQPLKYLWTAYFADGHVIAQRADDKYSKHDDTADWNPSAFRDVLDYESVSPLSTFTIGDHLNYHEVDVVNGLFNIENIIFSMEETPLVDRKLIFFREMMQEFSMDSEPDEPFVNRYCFGYEGKDTDGKTHKKIIYIK